MSEYVTFDQLREELHKKPDLVEVVRCRDCKHYRDISTKHARSGGIGTCDLGLEWTDLYSIVEPLGFCAWGERQGK